MNKEHSLACYLLHNFEHLMIKIQPVNTATLGICFAKCAKVWEIAIHDSPVFFFLNFYSSSAYAQFFGSELFQVPKFPILDSVKKTRHSRDGTI